MRVRPALSAIRTNPVPESVSFLFFQCHLFCCNGCWNMKYCRESMARQIIVSDLRAIQEKFVFRLTRGVIVSVHSEGKIQVDHSAVLSESVAFFDRARFPQEIRWSNPQPASLHGGLHTHRQLFHRRERQGLTKANRTSNEMLFFVLFYWIGVADAIIGFGFSYTKPSLHSCLYWVLGSPVKARRSHIQTLTSRFLWYNECAHSFAGMNIISSYKNINLFFVRHGFRVYFKENCFLIAGAPICR